MHKIFISYSHKDKDWKDRLLSQLGVLAKQGKLELWDDRRIAAGDDWQPEIEQAIANCNMAILLISANFLTSDFILGEEVPKLLQRRQEQGVRVIPLIAKPCAWTTVSWLQKIQARPKDGKPLSGFSEHEADQHLAALANEIHAMLSRTPGTAAATATATATAIAPDHITLAKLPATGPDLFGRADALQKLDDAWKDAHTNVLSLVAWGGVGKSALVNHWLSAMERDNYRGAERVYGWSFYSQGTKEQRQVSADGFFDDALDWFGYDGEPIPSAWDKGKKLAELVREHPSLLILDGLEPLQYPPGELQGQLKDQGMQALLKDLARANPGLCVISTRMVVAELEATAAHSSPKILLENLGPQAGAQLLRKLGVQGSDSELTTASNDFGGHALALNLLGSYLATVHGGEIRKRDLIPHLSDDLEKGGHARRVMVSYETWLHGKPELDILYLMGLFDRPASAEALATLRAEPAIAGLTEALHNLSEAQWHYAVKHLRDLRLLSAAENDKNSLDCHPLVREHFGEQVQQHNPDGWRAAHSRLYDYYKNLPEKLYNKQLPNTLEEMEPLFAAVAHGCLAGQHQQALDDVYWERIKRKNQHFSTAKLGAFGADLAALSNFFEPPWRQPADGLVDAAKPAILSWAGFRLRALGRLHEAAEPMQAGMEMRIEQKNWLEAAKDSGNLSELMLTIGEVAKAVDYGRQSVDYADRSGDDFQREVARTQNGDALHQSGVLNEAEKLFREAEAMQQKRQPDYRYLYSLRGFQFCDLLLSRGQAREVLQRAAQTLEWVTGRLGLLDVALDHLSLGRAHLWLALRQRSGQAENIPLNPPFDKLRAGTSKGDLQDSPHLHPERSRGSDHASTALSVTQLAEAETHLQRAVTGLRESGDQDMLPLALFALAELRRVQGQFEQALALLHEAQEIAERGGMGLHLVDFHLEACRTCLEELKRQTADGKREEKTKIAQMDVGARGRVPETAQNPASMQQQAKHHLESAAKLVAQTGYHRRDAEVTALQAEMGKIE